MLLDSPEQKAEEDNIQMKYLSEWSRKKEHRKPVYIYPTMFDVFICMALLIILLLIAQFTPQLAAWIVKFEI